MDKNQMVANELDKMDGLTERARHMIENTEIRVFYEMFGGLDADTINQMAEEFADTEIFNM